MALQPFVGTWPLLQFRNLFYTDGRTPRTSDQPVARPLPTHRATQTQNKRTHKHPCLKWDSNLRSQHSSERRQLITYLRFNKSRSQWPRSLRHELSSLARMLGSWVRILLKAWMSVCIYSVFVLFCV
jgi:hypothetical protein